jgi:hypothetical protein
MFETDVLIASDGKVAAFIIELGGFIGAGAKDVAVPFSDVKGSKKNDKWYLTMNVSRDELRRVLINTPGVTYESPFCPESGPSATTVKHVSMCQSETFRSARTLALSSSLA